MELQRVDPGYNTENVLTFRADIPFLAYPQPEQRATIQQQLQDRLAAVPGARQVTAAFPLPLAGDLINGRYGTDAALEDSRNFQQADYRIVLPGFFGTMQTSVLEGRAFTQADHTDSSAVAMVDEILARKTWPNESAVGKRFKLSANIDTIYRTVAGVTADVRHGGLAAEPRPEMYLPHAQHSATLNFPILSMNLMIRTANDPLALAGTVRRLVVELDPSVPLSSVQTMDDVVAASTSTERLNVTLFAVFGLLGLLLVSVGVYGVMSYFISQRARELGIRIALGAAPRSVLNLVVNHGLRLALVGAGVGVVGALSLGRFLSNLLYGVTWHDPITLVTVPALVTGVAVLACVIPARRAVRVDPINVLRSE